MKSRCPRCFSVFEHAIGTVEEFAATFQQHVENCTASRPVVVAEAETAERITPAAVNQAVAETQQTIEEGSSMGKFLSFLQMIPAIIGMVKQLEDAIPQKGAGSHKLAAVLNSVNAAVSAVPAAADALAGHDLPGFVSDVAGATVAAMKAAQGTPAPVPVG